MSANSIHCEILRMRRGRDGYPYPVPLERLFKTKMVARILDVLYEEPYLGFTSKALAKELYVSEKPLRRSLKVLVALKLVREDIQSDNNKHYYAEIHSPIGKRLEQFFDELRKATLPEQTQSI